MKELIEYHKKLSYRFNYCLEMSNKNKEKEEETFSLVWMGRADEVKTILNALENMQTKDMTEKYRYAWNINNSGRGGVIDIERNVTVCLCTPDFGKMICEAMNKVNPSQVDNRIEICNPNSINP